MTEGVSMVDSATSPAALESAVTTGQAVGVVGVAMLSAGGAALLSGLIAHATME